MNRIYYKHVRTAVNRLVNGKSKLQPTETGGVTLRIAEDETAKTVSVTFAICRDTDHYNKKLGRHIVDGRSKKESHTLTIPLPITKEEGVVSGVMSELELIANAGLGTSYRHHRLYDALFAVACWDAIIPTQMAV